MPEKACKSSFLGRGNKDFMSLRESSENWETNGLKVETEESFQLLNQSAELMHAFLVAEQIEKRVSTHDSHDAIHVVG